jgi:hypothetical protein
MVKKRRSRRTRQSAGDTVTRQLVALAKRRAVKGFPCNVPFLVDGFGSATVGAKPARAAGLAYERSLDNLEANAQAKCTNPNCNAAQILRIIYVSPPTFMAAFNTVGMTVVAVAMCTKRLALPKKKFF